jgi:hypothetical protein
MCTIAHATSIFMQLYYNYPSITKKKWCVNLLKLGYFSFLRKIGTRSNTFLLKSKKEFQTRIEELGRIKVLKGDNLKEEQ